LREFPGAASFASFVYQNHAGAYFSLLAFTSLGLAVWHFFEGRKRMARSTPSALWLIASLLLVFAVVFSLSRGAIISLTVFGMAAVDCSRHSAVHLLDPVNDPGHSARAGRTGRGGHGGHGWCVRSISPQCISGSSSLSKLQANDPSVVSRRLAQESATAMLGDHWVRGVGAGGFRYLYPEYIRQQADDL
jgi:hypothetical protein